MVFNMVLDWHAKTHIIQQNPGGGEGGGVNFS